jgi:hypothetical protein
MLPATPNPPPILTAPVVLDVDVVVSEKVGAPVNVPDTAPLLIVGDVRVLFVRVLVEDTVGTTTPSTEITPAEDRAIVVSSACPNSMLPTPSAVEVEAVMPLTGKPVAFVNVPENGVPRAPLNSTTAPADPVLTASAVATPVPSPEIPVATGRPVQLVNVPEDGVPNTGVVSVGLVRVLFVNVSVVARPTSVSVAAGKVKVVVPAVAEARTVVVPEVDPLNTAPVLPIVGRVRVLLVKVFVDDTVGTITPSTDITPAEERAIVVSVA